MKNFLLFAILFLSINSFSQTLKHTKQCFRTADFVDPQSKEILKTEIYSEVCIKFVNEKSAKIWVSNKEFDIELTQNELLETDENGFLIYRSIGVIGEIRFEIIYLVGSDYTYFVSLILMHNVPVKEYDKKVILQYKRRN